MDNIKALVRRVMTAGIGIEKSRIDIENEVKALVKNPSTHRAVLGVVGTVTPKAFEAAVTILEGIGTLYQEVHTKVRTLNEAMPAIAAAVEKANEGKDLLHVEELVVVGKLVEAEMGLNNEKKTKNTKRKQPSAN